MNKKVARLRRAKKVRSKIRVLNAVRLCVHRTAQHMYAQVVSSDGSKILCAASTLEKELRDKLKGTGNAKAAAAVGKLIAERAVVLGINEIAFDRSGFRYHGRIKALADAARESGLKF